MRNAPIIFNSGVTHFILFKVDNPTALGQQLGPIKKFLLSPVTVLQKDDLQTGITHPEADSSLPTASEITMTALGSQMEFSLYHHLLQAIVFQTLSLYLLAR